MLRIPHTAMWISMFFVACIFPPNIRTSELIGRRCCEENQVLRSGDCVPSNNATSFSPPFYANLSQPLETLAWHLEPVECPYGYEREYLPLNGVNNSLEIEEDMIYLKRLEAPLSKRSSDFCVGLDVDEENHYVAAFCLPAIGKICSERTCVQKCCPEGEVGVLTQGSCLKQNGTKFSPEFRGIHEKSVETPKDLLVVDGVPECNPIADLNPKMSPERRFFMLQNGMLYEPHNHQKFRVTTYCLDFFVDMGGDVALICREQSSRALEIKNQLQTIGLMLSCIFLSLTILLHLAIPTLRDMQSLCLVCHMVSLLVADSLFFTGRQFSKSITFGHCIANALLLQYSFLATFFWLNVMCFDVWRIIKASVNLVRLSGITSNDKKKFLLYCAYAWGVPLVIVIVTAVLHFLPDHLLYDKVIRPGFGTVSCWFGGDYALLGYFYVFVGLLFFVNLLLLGHTIAMMIQAGSAFKCCSRAQTITAFNRNHVDAFWQRFSLFCLMALCWMAEILSFKIYPLEIWIPTDILNSLQGFIVFVIFISSKKKRELIYNLWENIKSFMALAARTTSPAETTGDMTMKVTTTNSDNSTSTKDTNDIAPKAEVSTQDTSRAEKPSKGVENQGFEAEQNKNGE